MVPPPSVNQFCEGLMFLNFSIFPVSKIRWRIKIPAVNRNKTKSAAWTPPTMRIIWSQLTIVALVVVSLTLLCCAEAKTTPKPKYTKKPVSQITVHSPVTTNVPKTLKILPTAPVEPQPAPGQGHNLPQMHSGSTAPPGVGLDNYTMDYNECYFNFCECCPPEKGPRGAKGDTGLPGGFISNKIQY